ncbi:LA_3751/LA_3752 family putative glycosyltransferase [Planktothrix pseudagardhii]|uniref:Dolichol-phosphate mannosyltransferase n=1 Tax=Planktothrix pseudagardhii TaxID=132604 RepID=A0A9W4G9I9_9CYAN|nr:hypothetical protein [Planktothrix pseudagardhii]CAD5982117.1 hypothetical protein NO713_04937 [Planktothrix pseudagardhii]
MKTKALNLIKTKTNLIPLSIILLGILWTLFLVFQNPENIFFSGDGGLKALLARQWATGTLRFDLTLPTLPWVEELWKKGLYPFEAPFIYLISNQYYITFPFTFPLISAPFYSLFGYYGLYVIPLVSTWCIWLTFYWLCERFNISKLLTVLGLMTLIFGSPVSIYSATYWEHTLGVALSFGGVAILLKSNSNNFSKTQAIGSGILIGLSVWFREELILLVFLLFLTVFIYTLPQCKSWNLVPQHKLIFLGTMALTVLLFFTINFLIYHHPLGVHAVQVLEDPSLKSRIRKAIANFNKLNEYLFDKFPITFLIVIAYPLSILFHEKFKIDKKHKILFIISISFIILISMILPSSEGISLESRTGGKQWGPRFILPLIPIISWLTIISFKDLLRANRRTYLNYASLAFYVILLAVSIHKNFYSGSIYIQEGNKNGTALMNAIHDTPHQIVAVSHQYVSQGLLFSNPEKTILLVKDTESLRLLAHQLVKQGYPNFLYICYAHRPCPVPKENAQNLTFKVDNNQFLINFTELGKAGNTPLYQGVISKLS